MTFTTVRKSTTNALLETTSNKNLPDIYENEATTSDVGKTSMLTKEPQKNIVEPLVDATSNVKSVPMKESRPVQSKLL